MSRFLCIGVDVEKTRMLNKEKLSMIILFLGIMMFIPTPTHGEEIKYSDQLSIGDNFTWILGLKSESFGDFENGDIITMTVVKDTKTTTLDDYETIFDIEQNGNPYTLTFDDILFVFVAPTINGSENPTKDNWIFFIYDDFYFQEAPYSVSHVGDIAKYSGEINYADGGKGTFNGEVDTKYGITIGLRQEFYNSGDSEPSFVFTLDLTQSSVKLGTEETGFQLSFNFGFVAFGMGVVVLISRKMKNQQ